MMSRRVRQTSKFTPLVLEVSSYALKRLIWLLRNIYFGRYSYAIYAAHILCDEVDCLGVLKTAVPNVMPHKWADVASRRSDVYPQQV